jgi:hypothetical protein
MIEEADRSGFPIAPGTPLESRCLLAWPRSIGSRARWSVRSRIADVEVRPRLLDVSLGGREWRRGHAEKRRT